ncbi:MAG: hypothetical protein ACPG49_09630, partial [Chitinophagales bacterium]
EEGGHVFFAAKKTYWSCVGECLINVVTKNPLSSFCRSQCCNCINNLGLNFQCIVCGGCLVGGTVYCFASCW